MGIFGCSTKEVEEAIRKTFGKELWEARRMFESYIEKIVVKRVEELIRQLESMQVNYEERVKTVELALSSMRDSIAAARDRLREVVTETERLNKKINSSVAETREQLKNDYSRLLSHVLHVETLLGRILEKLDRLAEVVEEIEEMRREIRRTRRRKEENDATASNQNTHAPQGTPLQH